jgi:hypothetical protein
MFVGENETRRLVVVIGEEMFDVTSTVVGSAEEREILEKAEELIHQSRHSTRQSVAILDQAETLAQAEILAQGEAIPARYGSIETLNDPEPTSQLEISSADEDDDIPANLERRIPTIQQQIGEVLRAPLDAVQYFAEEPSFDGKPRSSRKPVIKEGEGIVPIRGSELLELNHNIEGDSLDELVQKSNKMTEDREDFFGVEQYEDIQLDNPFEKINGDSKTTVRPDLIVLLNPRENQLALREATNNQIPTIGIIDSDCDPRGVSYSIPGNDDSLRSVEYITGVLSRAGEEGLIHRRRYTEQLEFLQKRARQFLHDSWEDYGYLVALENGKPAPRDIIDRYCDWYKLKKESTPPGAVKKIVANHIASAQSEIKRLSADTKGWSMQDFLERVETSTQFPGVPVAVLEEMAQVRMAESRQAWAEAREKMDRRSFMMEPGENLVHT